ncbi:iron chaperone [Streptomyces puniciscabiei]
MNDAQKTARRTTSASGSFTDEERAAMKERAKEVRASARGASRAARAAEDEAAVLAKIAEMRDTDRATAERIHAVVQAAAPGLAPKLWYGMPAYALDGKVVCFFQSAEKFGSRYATFGFSDRATLDEGSMWPASYALKELSAADEARIGELVRKAVG